MYIFFIYRNNEFCEIMSSEQSLCNCSLRPIWSWRLPTRWRELDYLTKESFSFYKFFFRHNWAENFRMVDNGINAWSSLFDNLKIKIILQYYLKSVWKTIKFKLIFNHWETVAANQRKAGNQWESRNILIRENNLRISKETEKEWIRTKKKSFHSGYSDQEVRIKVYPF